MAIQAINHVVEGFPLRWSAAHREQARLRAQFELAGEVCPECGGELLFEPRHDYTGAYLPVGRCVRCGAALPLDGEVGWRQK